MKIFRRVLLVLLNLLPFGLGAVLWERNSWRPQVLWHGHTRVNAVSFSPDGHWLVAALGAPGERGQVQVWDGRTRALRSLIPLPKESNGPATHWAKALVFSSDNALLAVRAESSSGQDSVVLWDLRAGKLRHIWRDLGTVTFSADSRELSALQSSYAQSWLDSTPDLRVFGMRDGKNLRSVDLQPPRGQRFKPDDGSRRNAGYLDWPVGGWFVVAVWQPSVFAASSFRESAGFLLIDAIGQQSARRLSAQEFPLAFLRDGQTMLIENQAGVSEKSNVSLVQLRHIISGQILSQWALPPAEVSSDISPDNLLLLTNADGVRRLRDIRSGAVRVRLQGEFMGSDTRFSPDGTLIGGFDHWGTQVRIWDARTGKLMRQLENYQRVDDLAFSPDGATVIIASQDGSLKSWRLR